MKALLRSLWSEPRPPQPAGGGELFGVPYVDAAIVGVLAPLAVVEGLVRDIAWTPLAVVGSLVVIALLGFRRRHPFAVFCAAFAIAVGLDLLAFAAGIAWDGLYVSAAILLLPYSLFRWGAGREAVVGLAIMAFVYGSSAATDGMNDVGEAIGGGVVFLFPAVVGASVRFRAKAQQREVEAARSHERERLARDLHDTVAHHVSAIAIQAQAGRFVALTRPELVEQTFAAIEAEASRALGELRALVGILREGDAPLAPQPGLSDVERLARGTGDGRVVEVALAGDFSALRPSVEAAVFRIAQEAVTNAVRHAPKATRVSVLVEGAHDGVRVSVTDDGAAASPSSPGYGLAGMAERAALLGGTFHAGPRAEGGWRVEAFLPLAGPSS